MNVHKKLLAVISLAICAALAAPAAAHANGTGDDPRLTKDTLTLEDAKAKALEDARYEAWLGSKTGRPPARGTSRGRVRPTVVDAPYYYIWTPSHAQERSYWCGPATCQVIDDYWGTMASQLTIANYLGTTTGGTDFSRVDDALRYFTGKSYYYYGPLANESAFMDRVNYGIVSKHYPMATDVKIYGSVWPNYVYDHAGHIIPMEAYDGRYGTIRINDPYNEASWRSGGGSTFGHRTYGNGIIWNGVANHFRRAVIS